MTEEQIQSPPGLNSTVFAIESHQSPFERLATAIVALEDACACADRTELDYRIAKAEALLAATGTEEQREAEVLLKTSGLASAASAARRRADAIEHLVIFLRGQT